MGMIPQIPASWRFSYKPPFPADNRWALIWPGLGLGLPLSPTLDSPAMPMGDVQLERPGLHSLGTHCSRPELARGLWAHVAEGPHVELHFLGKVEVREAGQPGVDPEPSRS